MYENLIVSCPHCGREYMLNEILVPKYLLGNNFDVLRDTQGKITVVKGDEPCTSDTYICDGCEKEFRVSVDIIPTVSIEESVDFDTPYSAPLYEDRLTLKED